MVRSVGKRIAWRQLAKQYPGLSRKEIVELQFQKEWAERFKLQSVRNKCLEYWRTHRYLDDIIRIVQPNERTRTLDVGCGISSVLHFLPGQKHGIDPLADVYRAFYSYPDDVNVTKGYAESLSFEDNAFDVVFCSNVLDHVERPEAAVGEIMRVLGPKGYMILTVECFDKSRRRDPAHPHSLTLEKVKRLLSNWEIVFEASSPWIGLRRFVAGGAGTQARNREWVFVGRKPSRPSGKACVAES